MKSSKLFIKILCISLCVSFSSCSSDDDKYSKSDLVGTWMIVHIKGYESFTVNGVEERNDYEETYPDDMGRDSSVGEYAEFRENGDYYAGSSLSKLSYEGTWRIKGGSIIFEFEEDDEDEVISIKIVKLTADELVVEDHQKEKDVYNGIVYIDEMYEVTTMERVK